MSAVAYHLDPSRRPQLGLIVLRADETIEHDMRRLLPMEVELLVSRVQSHDQVTPETLAAMEGDLARAAGLLPGAARLAACGFACTSGTAQIGARQVAEILGHVTGAKEVTDPVSALVAACRAKGFARLAVLSPYVAKVAEKLCHTLARQGLKTPAVASFDIDDEATVVRIDTASVLRAATDLARGTEVDAMFLSCTNLRTLDAIPAIEDATGLPVLSSNTVLAWHLLQSAGVRAPASAPGRLFRD